MESELKSIQLRRQQTTLFKELEITFIDKKRPCYNQAITSRGFYDKLFGGFRRASIGFTAIPSLLTEKNRQSTHQSFHFYKVNALK